MTLKEQMQKDLKNDLPAWVYRGIAVALMGVLFSVILWNGGRILKGIEDTQDSVSGLERSMVRIETKLEDHERRLSKAEERLEREERRRQEQK